MKPWLSACSLHSSANEDFKWNLDYQHCTPIVTGQVNLKNVSRAGEFKKHIKKPIGNHSLQVVTEIGGLLARSYYYSKFYYYIYFKFKVFRKINNVLEILLLQF